MVSTELIYIWLWFSMERFLRAFSDPLKTLSPEDLGIVAQRSSRSPKASPNEADGAGELLDNEEEEEGSDEDEDE